MKNQTEASAVRTSILAALPESEAIATSFIGPYGEAMTVGMLPPRDTRWTARRKAEVVAAVRSRVLTIEFACQWYNISEQEFRNWDKALDHAGLRALKTTKLKRYRAIYRD